MEYPSLEEINKNLKRFMLPRTYEYNYPEFYKYIKETYPFADKFSEGLYCFHHNIIEPPRCPVCNKPVKFHCWNSGYKEFCGSNCMKKGTRERAKQTMIKRYGGIGFGSEVTKKKITETNIAKYGDPKYINHQQSIKTQQELYGGLGFGSKIMKQKITETMLFKYGSEHALQNPLLLEKCQNTLYSHYGVKTPMESDELREKHTIINRELHKHFASPNHPIRKKIIEANRKRYSRDWGFDYDKAKQTNLKRYGSENPLISKCLRGEIKYHGYSKMSQECFKEIDRIIPQYNTFYAEHGGEKLIECDAKKYYVDYFILELNTAIEFNGDVFHGNPKLYGPNDNCMPFNKSITAKDLWEKDKIKYDAIKSQGIRLIVLWESEYLEIKNMELWVYENILNN